MTNADSATIPLPDELKEGNWGGWHDPSVSQEKQLYWEYYHELNARRMIETCESVKKASGDRLLVGGFYGYVGDSYGNSEPAAWLYGHHHKLSDVTEHPAVDFLAAHIHIEIVNQAVLLKVRSLLHRLIWQVVLPSRKTISAPWAVRDESPEGIAKWTCTMIRDQGQRIIRRQGFWWMDVADDFGMAFGLVLS